MGFSFLMSMGMVAQDVVFYPDDIAMENLKEFAQDNGDVTSVVHADYSNQFQRYLRAATIGMIHEIEEHGNSQSTLDNYFASIPVKGEDFRQDVKDLIRPLLRIE